ncbi:unnamed protein product [Brachionus calyciflorus]|uniref:Alpha-1,4-N-acetylglucosaminyltransferase n=1 Tax=Brachionus calyciflorus TaxID=104777 RepID=A0A813MGB8_9BILA|nr:unnamed protein product [Brachionus calyciflorus]
MKIKIRKNFLTISIFSFLIICILLLKFPLSEKLNENESNEKIAPRIIEASTETLEEKLLKSLYKFSYNQFIDFENFNNRKGSRKFIIPNVVHLLYLNTNEIKFYQAINIYSIFLNQNPDFILIHCNDCKFSGHYWEQINSIKELKDKIILNKIKFHETIFGQEYGWIEHASDTWRLMILMNYGGIYLDNDVFVINSLNKYRKYELSVGWESYKEVLGTQVLIAHRNARLLRAHFDAYRTAYNSSEWYYNAGIVPTNIVLNHSYMAHTVRRKFGVGIHTDELYKQNWSSWKRLDTIHLLINHRSYLDEESPIKDFDEENILSYPYTYGEMCRLIMSKISKLYNIDFKRKSIRK